jgi:hypothetical protein
MENLTKMENLTLEQVRKADLKFIEAGSKQTLNFSTVEPGVLEGKPDIVTSGKTKTVNFFIIPYVRDNEQRHFSGAYFNSKHLATGKSYDKLAVSLSDEDKERVNEPENRGKSYDLRAVEYTNSAKEKRVIVKMI